MLKAKSKRSRVNSSGKRRPNNVDDTETIEVVPIDSVRPAAVNNSIYRPPNPNDPTMRELAELIRQHGQLQAAHISLDDVILNGHRRHLACKMAGLTTFKVHRFPILSTDPGFEALLVAFNSQRTKSADEIFREELIKLNPFDARRELVDYRTKSVRTKAKLVKLDGFKRRATISAAKEPFLKAIIEVLEDKHDFWPLSDRSIHYGLLNNPPLIHAGKPDSRYRNDATSYKALTELLTRARLQNRIAFDAIADSTRPVVNWNVFPGIQPFIAKEMKGFLRKYYRDLQRTQPIHLEIVGEKNTVEGIIRPVAMDYCIPYTIGRGYSSLPPRNDMAKRLKASGKERLVILFLSDFDPEGDDIPRSFARSLRDDFGVENVGAVKVALTKEQVRRLRLIPRMKAKSGSSRHKRFVDQHGDNVFELEAVPPETLQQFLRAEIDKVLDVDAYNAEVDREANDAADLDAIRRQLRQSFARFHGDDDDENSTMAQFDDEGD
jgi:hypothetical protein